ncbi:hypothetical protein DFH09DRAFT_1458179 [Mycena vulgaris]|nr:hypothetical protein DFH09DRAFT_1458179 [Mycena vulgaris]
MREVKEPIQGLHVAQARSSGSIRLSHARKYPSHTTFVVDPDINLHSAGLKELLSDELSAPKTRSAVVIGVGASSSDNQDLWEGWSLCVAVLSLQKTGMKKHGKAEITPKKYDQVVAATRKWFAASLGDKKAEGKGKKKAKSTEAEADSDSDSDDDADDFEDGPEGPDPIAPDVGESEDSEGSKDEESFKFDTPEFKLALDDIPNEHLYKNPHSCPTQTAPRAPPLHRPTQLSRSRVSIYNAILAATKHAKMQTPPTSPQRHQYRARQILRDINVSQDNSPRRRRVPASFDENRPPSPPRSSTPTPGSRANARSLAQAERRERERRDRAEDPPRIRKRKRPPRPELDGPPNARQLAQRKRRERERMEEENRIRTRVPILPLARFSNTQSTFTCPKGVIQWPFHTSRNTAAQWSET